MLLTHRYVRKNPDRSCEQLPIRVQGYHAHRRAHLHTGNRKKQVKSRLLYENRWPTCGSQSGARRARPQPRGGGSSSRCGGSTGPGRVTSAGPHRWGRWRGSIRNTLGPGGHPTGSIRCSRRRHPWRGKRSARQCLSHQVAPPATGYPIPALIGNTVAMTGVSFYRIRVQPLERTPAPTTGTRVEREAI